MTRVVSPILLSHRFAILALQHVSTPGATIPWQRILSIKVYPYKLSALVSAFKLAVCSWPTYSKACISLLPVRPTMIGLQSFCSIAWAHKYCILKYLRTGLYDCTSTAWTVRWVRNLCCSTGSAEYMLDAERQCSGSSVLLGAIKALQLELL